MLSNPVWVLYHTLYTSDASRSPTVHEEELLLIPVSRWGSGRSEGGDMAKVTVSRLQGPVPAQAALIPKSVSCLPPPPSPLPSISLLEGFLCASPSWRGGSALELLGLLGGLSLGAICPSFPMCSCPLWVAHRLWEETSQPFLTSLSGT